MATEQRLSQAERNNLVAYLDGELNDAERHAIATKLTRSVSARREVEALERTWELLDFLPFPKASPEFTARTLTQATELEGRGDRVLGAARSAASRAARVAACVATAAATLAVGYIGTRWIWPDPTARLARDLSIAEHVDEYQAVESFEFLKLLDENPGAFQ